MRARILDRIYKEIEKNPSNSHLQKQVTLISKANICTIDAFCLEIVKNNFFEINISPNMKIAEGTEIEILKREVLEDLFEQKYENEEKSFLKLIDTYTGYRGDDSLKDIILEIYNYIQNLPFPEIWLEEKIEMFNLEEDSFEKTLWGNIIFEKIKEDLNDSILKLNNELKKLEFEENAEKIIVTLSEDIRKISYIYNKKTWNEVYEGVNNISLDRFPTEKRVPDEIKDRIKNVRKKVKDNITNIKQKIMVYDSDGANENIKEMYSILKIIQQLVLEFENKFMEEKQNKNIMDFNDIEHYALKIFTSENADNIVSRYKEKFTEILIDEYQDSNLVQEYILNTISRNNNIFMVGDVKQSIYKFRGARPELFLQKYETYKEIEKLSKNDNLKILLYKNFRSRDTILNFTNIIFESIMSRNLGDIDYNEKEFLNLGANYPEGKNLNTEIHIIDLKEQEESIYKDESEENQDEEETERIEDILIEAKFVAKKIKELIDSEYMVCNKDNIYRKITYKDIAILLRSPSNLAPIYEQEISKLNMPVFSDTTVGYLDSIEIQVIMSLLKIIDNPLNDIALITVLRSMIGEFTDNELIQIRIENKKNTYFEAMQSFIENVDADDYLKNKVKDFLGKIEEFRKVEEYLPLDEFIWKIYEDTRYYNYVSLMPNGALRTANLKILFQKAKQYEKTSFKGLYNFISFIDKLRLSNKDMSGAKLIGENEDVIRIMSIHKSKGLEFPVVFLSGTGKRFNMQDLNVNTILLHQDIGFGPKYINYEKSITYNTLARESIKIKAKGEMLSEEMRILYVALTRAKEKLIITGMQRNYNDSIRKKEELLSIYKDISKGGKINKNIIQNYITYLDWIELVYLNSKDKLKNILNLDIYQKDKLLKELVINEKIKEQDLKEMLANIKIKDENKLKEILEWKYKYKSSNSFLTKSSVSKIKNLKLDFTNEEKNEYNVPGFLKDQTEITSDQKGTLIHLVFQYIDSKFEYDKTMIEELLNNLQSKNVISEKERKVIDIDKIYNFTKSNIMKEMKNAKVIEKEKPFYINIDAKEIYGEDIDEKILVQGIIDLYYITEDDELILVDYKTDRVKDEKELIDKYKIQLEIYKDALEKALNKKVDSVYIYSVYLDKEIKL